VGVFGSKTIKKCYGWGSKLPQTWLNTLIIMAYEGVNGLYLQASHLGEQAIYKMAYG
jgi:hypothetical protein